MIEYHNTVFVDQLPLRRLVHMPASGAAWCMVVGPGDARAARVRGSGKRPAPSEKAYRDIYIPTQNYFSSPPPTKRAVGVVKILSLKNFKKPEKAWLITGKNKLRS